MKRHRKHKLIEELKKTPIIELACNNIGISRQTYYRWLDILPNFQAEVEEAMNYGISHINDVCESKVLKKIQNDDWRAIKYWLDHNHPK